MTKLVGPYPFLLEGEPRLYAFMAEFNTRARIVIRDGTGHSHNRSQLRRIATMTREERIEFMVSELPSDARLDDPSNVGVKLLLAGFRGEEIGELLDDVIELARKTRSGDTPRTFRNAALDCFATAMMFAGGVAGLFIANILDASVSDAMAAIIF